MNAVTATPTATADGSLADRLGQAARAVDQLVEELAAADELITELVTENEHLRDRLAWLSGPAGTSAPTTRRGSRDDSPTPTRQRTPSVP